MMVSIEVILDHENDNPELAHQGHADHARVIRWYASLMGSDGKLGTCAITEIGFVRVSIRAGFENNVSDAVETLLGLKESSRIPFEFLADPLGADRLPAYVSIARQETDGHLLELGNEAAMQLATLDKGIPGAVFIP